MSFFGIVVVVTNIGFTAGYDTCTANPSWVAYDLDPGEVVKSERPSVPFSADPRLGGADRAAVFPRGYDKGHLAPAADFNWDREALRQTFLYSNVSPMEARFNRGVWAQTEREVRKLASSGTVRVVVWPQVDRGEKIPRGFHKVAYGWFGVKYWYLEQESPSTERTK